MNSEWLKVLRDMRSEGYAVVVWTPEELKDTDPRTVEHTSQWLKTLRDMRDAGYAVIVWTPAELQNTDPRMVEDASISYASEYLIDQGESK